MKLATCLTSKQSNLIRDKLENFKRLIKDAGVSLIVLVTKLANVVN